MIPKTNLRTQDCFVVKSDEDQAFGEQTPHPPTPVLFHLAVTLIIDYILLVFYCNLIVVIAQLLGARQHISLINYKSVTLLSLEIYCAL